MIWYIKRILTFSFAEFFFRLKQYYKGNIVDRRKSNDYPLVETLNTVKVLSVTDDIIDKLDFSESFFIFSTPYQTKDIVNWHYDPYSGNTFPQIFYKDINIRSHQTGSAKHVWEVNRMVILPHLAIAYRKTRDQKHLSEIIRLLESWKIQNPYLTGVNWYSNIEVNIRLINWFLTWEILDADKICKEQSSFNTFCTNTWLPLIHRHCVYSYENPSLFSSANNHLLSEYSGLFTACSKWVFPESAKWLKYAQKGLEKEIQLQHSAEGINKEQASEYIQFITDFLFYPYFIGIKTNNLFSKNYTQTFKKILEYIDQLLDIKGNYLRYGDDDDGRVAWLDCNPHHNNFVSLLISGDILFHTTFAGRYTTEPDQKNMILFGEDAFDLFRTGEITPSKKESRIYRPEGHCFLRTETEDSGIVEFYMDAAPLGFLSIAAHGHSDALAVQLKIDENEILIDPGTYCYHTDPAWRAYFTSSLAHNTITINHENQATYIGPTLWINHYTCSIDEVSDLDDIINISASHNGYNKIGVSHSRTVRFEKNKLSIQISDSIHAQKPNETFPITFPLHIHPQNHVELKDKTLFIHIPNKSIISIKLDQQLEYELLFGNENPIAGWYSPGFYIKKPCWMLLGKGSLHGKIELKTIIQR